MGAGGGGRALGVDYVKEWREGGRTEEMEKGPASGGTKSNNETTEPRVCTKWIFFSVSRQGKEQGAYPVQTLPNEDK